MGRSGVQINKAHKSRFGSKSSRNIHKVSLKGIKTKNIVKSHSGSPQDRVARMQRSKMLREQKCSAILREKKSLSRSQVPPPLVIVLFGLSASTNIDTLEAALFKMLKNGESAMSSSTVASFAYRLRATILKAPHGDLLSCVEMAKVADLIAFVAASASSSREGKASDYVDSFGSQCLSIFRSIGLPSTVVLIRDLPAELKSRNEVKQMCASCLGGEFPEGTKFCPADTNDDLHKFLWLYKDQRLTAPHWRNQRPYVASSTIDMIDGDLSSGKCTLLVGGYVCARSLSVNQLVHVAGAGDFQLKKIETLIDPFPLRLRKDYHAMDADGTHDAEVVVREVVPDPLAQEALVVENVPDPLLGEQTWPTEEEMAEADRNEAAWIIDDQHSNCSSDSCCSSSDGDADNDDMMLDESPSFLPAQQQVSHGGSDGETQNNSSMMMEGESLTKEEIEEEIKRIKESHAEDEEFPDEVDVPVDVPARKRFAKYRGLKSFRTSQWDPHESLPREYGRIFAFDNFARTQKHALAKAHERDQAVNMDDCVPVGAYARLHINEVPIAAASKLCSMAKVAPVIVSGLLQHESKMSVVHFSIKKHDAYVAPIKSKDELLFHVGFRQFLARPIFSTNNSNSSSNANSDKSKMERFLHAGRFSSASIYAPISFPPLPLLAFGCARGGGAPALAAVGSLRAVDPNHIVLKRIILTGYPQRVSRKKAFVKLMFHNQDDVRWFKPVELWTKCGKRGRIMQHFGTHGTMQCTFSGSLQQHDTVCISLYKRVYPSWPCCVFPIFDPS